MGQWLTCGRAGWPNLSWFVSDACPAVCVAEVIGVGEGVGGGVGGGHGEDFAPEEGDLWLGEPEVGGFGVEVKDVEGGGGMGAKGVDEAVGDGGGEGVEEVEEGGGAGKGDSGGVGVEDGGGAGVGVGATPEGDVLPGDVGEGGVKFDAEDVGEGEIGGEQDGSALAAA